MTILLPVRSLLCAEKGEETAHFIQHLHGKDFLCHCMHSRLQYLPFSLVLQG